VDRKLDGRLAQAMMSIPAIKAVGIGRGPAAAALPGSRVHDEILAGPRRPAKRPGVARRPTTREASKAASPNGEDLRVSGYMKPIGHTDEALRSSTWPP